MNSVKLNRKHLFTFVLSIVLLFSFNFNTFAETSSTYDFSTALIAGCEVTNGTDIVNVTDLVKLERTTHQGYSCTRLELPYEYRSYTVRLLLYVDNLKLYQDYEYDFTFGFKDNFGRCEFGAGLVFVTPMGDIISSSDLVSGNITGSNFNHFNASFVVPKINQSYRCMVEFVFNAKSGSGSSIARALYFEDLKVTIADPYQGAVNTPDTGLGNAGDELENAMGELPTLNQEDYDKLFDIDFSTFSNSLNFIRTQFDKIMDVSGMGVVLTFTLAIGFAIYIIGKKVG